MSTYPVSLSGTMNTLMRVDETGIEEPAIKQPRNVSALPWTHGLCVMPDVRYGKGATARPVIAVHQVVAPVAVGIDIGCGMTAMCTNLSSDRLPDDLGRLRRTIERGAPVGNGVHEGHSPTIGRYGRLKRRLKEVRGGFESLQARWLARPFGRFETKAVNQTGTLSGGNHLIELCARDDDRIWVILHFGSRGIGNRLAQEHMKVVQSLTHNKGLVDRDLAAFLSHTPQMEVYLHDLWWTQSYALLNRDVMFASICDDPSRHIPRIAFEDLIRCYHNYVTVETYDDLELIITRKGVIRVGKGDLGVIPDSVGAGSYIVWGLGNLAFYESASYDAGRRMSRGQAKQRFTIENPAKQTRGIECRKDPGVVDEIPTAYKDINEVIRAQSDLVEVVARLRTPLCIKGWVGVASDVAHRGGPHAPNPQAWGMSLASRQRESLCDLMSELGPLTPTRCDGWDVGDLAAYLWIREYKPASLPGIGSKRFAEFIGRIQVEALHLKGFPVLVEELCRPGWVMRPFDGIVNAVEFFIHHEDVLRANGRTQHLTDKDQAELPHTARVLVFRAQRAWDGQLILVLTVGEAIHHGRRNRPLRLVGPPSELLLFLTGRGVDTGITAEPETVEEF